MRLILLLFLCCSAFVGQCQIEIAGTVLQNGTRQAIAYVNIGILGTEIGTLSNEDGSFRLIIPQKYEAKELLFSSIGFEPKAIPINAVSSNNELTVLLTEKDRKLQTVEISAKREKRKSQVLGNGKSLLLSGQLYSDTISAGSAMALLIDKSTFPEMDFVQKASLYIAKNKFPTFKVRLRFLKVDSAQQYQPAEDLIQEQLIESSNMNKGWLDFSLPKSYFIHDQAFYIVFEWILEEKDRRYIAQKYAEYMQMYPDRVSYDTTIINGEKLTVPKVSTVVAGTVFGTTGSTRDLSEHICYYRTNSFGKWKRSTGILSAKIEMGNYPFRKNTAKPAHSQKPDRLSSINQWVEQFKQEQGMPGLQVAISQKGKTVFAKSYGYADVAQQQQMTNQTRLRIASLSKTMTASALAKMFVEQKLDLDAPVQQYVPSFPKKKYPISLRQVAGHLGGIRGYYGKSWEKEIFLQKHYNNSTEALELFKEDTLALPPSTSFLYSSYGYILLAAAMEKVSQQSYLDYMQSHFWQALNMESTYGDVKGQHLNKSKFYYLTGEEAKPYDLSYSYPTGGLLSTSEDLLQFGNALLFDTAFFSQAIKTELFSTQFTKSGKATNYGLGWYIGKDKHGHQVYYHTGELPSSGAIFLIYPEEEIVLAILSNAPIVSSSDNGFFQDVQELVELVD